VVVGLRELVGFIGLAFLTGGVTLQFGLPYALIVAGALLFGLAVVPLLTAPGKGD
jgi:hypothetical protein